MTIKLSDFYTAWHWLNAHPAFVSKGDVGNKYPLSMFHNDLTIMVAKVDPTTNRIEDDESRNIKTRVWLECGPRKEPTSDEYEWICGEWHDYGIPSHDIMLDCGADTFEEAIIKLANLVHTFYGDYNNSEAV
jgi:hypothetical protein